MFKANHKGGNKRFNRICLEVMFCMINVKIIHLLYDYQWSLMPLFKIAFLKECRFHVWFSHTHDRAAAAGKQHSRWHSRCHQSSHRNRMHTHLNNSIHFAQIFALAHASCTDITHDMAESYTSSGTSVATNHRTRIVCMLLFNYIFIPLSSVPIYTTYNIRMYTRAYAGFPRIHLKKHA